MFESNIKANEFIEELKEEIDVALPIPDSYYYSWLNSAEQLLYSEIIKEQKITLAYLGSEGLKYNNIAWREKTDEEDKVRFSDIYTIYADDLQLSKINKATLHIFDNVFFENGEYLGIKVNKPEVELGNTEIRIIYFVRPLPKSIGSEQTIKLPIEFIDMIRAKVRGEAYKFANEDGLAAKWLNEYNVSVENFKVWIKNREANFGM